jgi:hypothetical protein
MFELLKKGGKTIKEVWIDVTLVYKGDRFNVYKNEGGREYVIRVTKKGMAKIRTKHPAA